MNGQKNILGIIMSAIMVFSMIPLQSFGATGLPFKDVPSDAWYYNDVQEAYDTGLINGYEDHTFRPDTNMTYAQAVKLAACMNQKYTTGSVTLTNGINNWWDSYVDYAKDNNIINKDYDWNSNATRAGYVEIFAKALPEEALKSINRVDDGAIPDVDINHPQASSIYRFYRAGILIGMDDMGNFLPDDKVRRSEVSAILIRLMKERARKTIELTLSGVINDSWEEIIASINDGTYKRKYKVGDKKKLDLGPQGNVYMQIAAFDEDELADGSGKAAITWISQELLKSEYRMNQNQDQYSSGSYMLGTGSIGGWEYSDMRAWLNSNVKPLIPATVREALQPVTKYSISYYPDGSMNQDASTVDEVWIPSAQEIFGQNENKGPTYAELFNSDSSRIKSKKGASKSTMWWLRSAYKNNESYTFGYVSSSGSYFGNNVASTTGAVALGFCLSATKLRKETGTIKDSWEQIIASVNDGTYKNKYKIGDTKSLDLGPEGVVDMQIVAFDADELEDGSGKAAITWISKQLLNSEHRMNPSTEMDYSTSQGSYKTGTGGTGGWRDSEMRIWLKRCIKPLIPSIVQRSIKPVKKYSTSFDNFNKKVENEMTVDDLWIPSLREVFGDISNNHSSNIESKGPTYTELFASTEDRMKSHIESETCSWWMRSANLNYYFSDVSQYGFNNYYYSEFEQGVALGFCL